MRSLVLAAALLLPTAASAETLWVGNAFVVDAPPVCGTAAAKGDFGRVTYRPADPGLGNGADSYFVYTTSRASFATVVLNNTFRSGINYGSQIVSSQLNFGSRTSGILAWTQSPTTFGTNTLNASISAQLANFFNVTGCTVTLQIALNKTL